EGAEVRGRGAQVAVVDPHQAGVGGDRDRHLLGLVGLDQGGDAAARGGLEAFVDTGRTEHGDDEQHRIGAGGTRLGHLERVDDEVLAQHRQRNRLAGGDEVVERAAEGGTVGENRERGGTGVGVGPGGGGAVELG